MSQPEQPGKYGKCRIQKEIGSGAVSTVYLAWHEALQISVALKVMQKEKAQQDPSLSRRVMREANIAAQLTHPNVIRIYDCGETEDAYYLVLEYIEGENCLEILNRQGPLEWQRAAKIIRQVADGLRHAHERGVIHRDLKPQNIMIDGSGNARIADLGLAKIRAPGKPSETMGGDVLGTAYYMSPEQIRQPGEADFRSDIYSLGATLYHMVTGQPPFDAPTPFEVMAKHLDAPLPSPREVRPELPDDLCAVIVRAMAKQPAERYESYEALLGALDRVLAGQPVVEGVAEATPAGPDGAPATLELAEETKEAAERARQKRRRKEREGAPAVALKPIAPEQLPVMAEHVGAKMMGMFSLLAYAFSLVWLYHLSIPSDLESSPARALVVFAGILLASGIWSYLLSSRGTRTQSGEESAGLYSDLKAGLAELCERLGLPVPRLYVSRRVDNACFAYGLSARRACVDIPGGWLSRADLSTEETQALLAHGLSSIYGGDSNIRTLLALPMEFLKARRWVVQRALDLLPPTRARLRHWLVGALTLAVLAVIALVLGLLFWRTFLGGALGLLFVGLLLLLAAFERSCCRAGDAFAVRVVGSRDVVKSFVAVSGLTGGDGYQLRRELGRSADVGAGAAAPDQGERRALVGDVVSHYSEVEYVAGILERIRLLFSPVPSCGERLNQLAGLAGGHLAVAEAVWSARRMFGALAGSHEEEETMCLRELAGIGLHETVGAAEGAAAVLLLLLALLLPWGAAHYAGFLVLLAILGSASGVLLAALLLPRRLSASRFGWAVIVTSVSFTCASMLGVCLVGGRTLSQFALHFPVSLVLIAFFAFLIGALVARLWEMIRTRMRPAAETSHRAPGATGEPADDGSVDKGDEATGAPSDSADLESDR